MALYNLISREQAFGQANNNYTGDDPSLRLYNLLNGKKPDAQYSTDDNFFSKKARSLENAFGTTGAALVSAVDSARENDLNEKRQEQARQSLDDIAKKYGYKDRNDFYNASDQAERDIFNKYGFDSDAYWDKHSQIYTPANANSQELKDLEASRQDVINRMSKEDADAIRKFEDIQNEFNGQTKTNVDIADKAAKDWKNYREDSYVGKKVNQDRGKFLGSSINTLSTMSDVLLPGAGVAFNAVQGGAEGIADELEQSGFKNFDWERAKQNAIIGATTGAVTGGLNKGISNTLAKNGGNLFKGGNALTRGLNNLGSSTAAGRIGSTLATGAARGAVSGAVGGATGAGLSAAMNGQDVLQSALQGAAKGAQQGAATGAIMSGANMALSKTPGVGNVMQQLNEAGENWKNSGRTFDERLTNTLNSGDSAVGNWLNRKTQSNLLGSAGSIGNRIQDTANVGNVDPWDRIAQQNGYENYDEVIQRYMEANPDTPLNPNGAAGQILTWLDQNPNTPTTARGWLKRAGERVLEDANNRGVGLSIKDVANENQGYTDDIRNMKINQNGMLGGTDDGTEPITAKAALARAGDTGENPPRNPATELYNSLNRQPEEPIDLTESFGDKGLGTIQKKNKLQSLGQQVQNSAKVQKYAPVYDSLDARTAKRAAETNAPQQLADLGVRPQDYNEYAKTSSYVNRVMSDLAERSGVKINAPDLPSKLSADNIDVVMSDSALKKYNGYIKQIVPDGDSPAQYSASYLLEKSRELGNKAANLRGNTDDVGALRQALTDAKWTLRDIATNALEGSMVTGDATNDMIANGLKDLGANQKVQDYYTEAVDGKAPSVADYIRRSSLFEQARDMGTQIEAEKYTRSASKQPTRFATKLLRASGIEQPLETVLRNTVAPVASGVTNLAGKAIEGAGNAYAKISGNGSVDSTGNTRNSGVVTPEVVTNPDYNPQTRLYNVIGRTEGLTNAEQARTASYLADAAQEAEVVPNTNVAGTGATMDSMQSATPTTNANTASTALYNTINGTQQTNMPTYSSTEEERAVYFFPPTGDYWSDMLSRAIRRAKNAEDYDAMASLYEMYQDATASLAKQANSSSESSTASKKLTATQQRANAAMNSLERISTMEPDLGYNLSQIPVIGNIATLGGNDYEAEAKSLAQQIGYMVSGANIKEEEAYNIGKAYVPQPFDSEQTRKNKLQRAYDIIQQSQNGYSE